MVLNDINYFTFYHVICYGSSNNIKFKIWIIFFFTCNFSDKIFANVLFFVRVTLRWDRFCFLFSLSMIALSLFSGDAFKKYANKQKISIGRCPANVSFLSDLKTLIAFISDSIGFSQVSALRSKFFSKDDTQISL